MANSDVRLEVRGATGGCVRLFGGAVTLCLFGGIAVNFSATREGEDLPGGAVAAVVPPLVEVVARLAA
ncbi:hypothetical protein [Azospirillum soli]|uniref:hypothetical protein n=1 Tax=Azospirillum soli TaxID=1304799 RepID=UPI001AEA79EB|nr:hypothetical protein [Azospirillum soli]MBP2316946.1 hypothetical protein [Azospirillum soli]